MRCLRYLVLKSLVFFHGLKVHFYFFHILFFINCYFILVNKCLCFLHLSSTSFSIRCFLSLNSWWCICSTDILLFTPLIYIYFANSSIEIIFGYSSVPSMLTFRIRITTFILLFSIFFIRVFVSENFDSVEDS